jgi:hypothetical protein
VDVTDASGKTIATVEKTLYALGAAMLGQGG